MSKPELKQQSFDSAPDAAAAKVQLEAIKLVTLGTRLPDADMTPELAAAVREYLETILGAGVPGAGVSGDTAPAENAACRQKAEIKRELTSKQADRLVGTLKSRFDFDDSTDEKLRETVDFAEVEKSLRASPEKLYALFKLEEIGGETQLIGAEGDEFIFEDRSVESPSGRRNLNAHEAFAQAQEFGADMQSPEAYRAMQETGKYDLKTVSWLETDAEARAAGHALGGLRHEGGVRVSELDAVYQYPHVGWRASLRVKKA